MKKIRQLHKTELRIVNSSINSTERSRRRKSEGELNACTWRAPPSVRRALPLSLSSNGWFRHISVCQHAHLQNWEHTQGHRMWPHRSPLPDSRDATKARPCAHTHIRTHARLVCADRWSWWHRARSFVLLALSLYLPKWFLCHPMSPNNDSNTS